MNIENQLLELEKIAKNSASEASKKNIIKFINVCFSLKKISAKLKTDESKNSPLADF